MTNSYNLRPRPNLFDLALMEGVLNGGGIKPNVQREAYWAEPQIEDMEIFALQEYPESLDE